MPSLAERRRLFVPVANRWGDGEMAVLEFGPQDRPVDLIFAHANGFNALTYRTLLAPLADRFRIWAPDLRGHGLSRLPAELKARRGWTDHRDDLVALIDSLEAPVGLSGHSMGGTSALLAAAERPDKVTSVCLFDPVIWRRAAVLAFNLPILDRAARKAPIVVNALKRRATFDSRDQALKAYSGRGAFKGWPEQALADYLTDGLIETADGFTLACPPEWEASNYAAQAHDPWRALARYPGPVRIFKGETGWATHMPAGARGRVSVETVPGGDHFFPMLLPGAARAALEDTLARRP